MLGGDVYHTGRSAFVGPGPGVMLKWKALIGVVNPIYSSPVLGPDGTLYIANSNVMYALNGQTGAQKWNVSSGGSIYSTPVLSQSGALCYGSADQNFLCLDAACGGSMVCMLWRVQANAAITGSPLLLPSGLVVCGSQDHSLYAWPIVNPQTLTNWTYQTGDMLYHSTPAMTQDGNIVVGSSDMSLYKLNAGTGRLMWNFTTMGRVDSSPAVLPDGSVVFGSDDHSIYCLYSNGTLRWKTPSASATTAGPSLGRDGTVYLGGNAGIVMALDGATGNVRWSHATGGTIFSNVIIDADNTVYVASANKTVTALDGAAGSVQWVYTAGDSVTSSLALGADGTLYFAAQDGCVYALTTAPSPTPTVR
jgi:outer membrane protein assembly factor BamB